MEQEPDESEAFWQGHYATRAEAAAMAADIEKLAALTNRPIPRTEIKHDREGGWNVWIWE